VGETPDLTIVAVGNGLSWTVGAGFDIYLGQTVAITPYISYLGSNNTSTTVNDVGIDVNLNPNMWQFGGALTIP
jgi:hypothetical protein